MITPAFIWLVLSHITVLFPIYVGYKLDVKKWKSCLLILFVTAFFSVLYHWKDQDNFSGDFIFLGTNGVVHKYMDYIGSYMSFFNMIFYSINLDVNTENFDFSLIIINLICIFLGLIEPQWYSFMIIICFFILLYVVVNKDNILRLFLRTLIKHYNLTILTALLFVLSMVMQYDLCAKYGRGYYYQIFHGFWHFFLFLTAGLLMILNKFLVDEANEENNNNQVKLFCLDV